MSLHRVVNSWALILVDQKGSKHYLRALGRWFEAGLLDGPWSVAVRPNAALDAAMQSVQKSQRVNLLDDPGPEVKDAVARGVVPAVYVSTVPAELIQTRGRPDYEPIEGTDLLHVGNSSANIVLDPADQRHYVLLSGRWFRSASLADGPWEYVAHDKLPAAFARIPDTHPRGAVLASVPGTPQAKEALIDNSIPQTAEVNRTTTTYQATYDGTPKFQPIDGTPLHHAANSPVPVIQVAPNQYYSLKDGVWFTATSATGPWTVATSVPAVIYTIPPSSPLHYVTYVHVYGGTPQTVYVGYTPGYYGTVVAPTSVVVYGTGYVYPPVYVGAYWYPPPRPTGMAAGFGWGAVTGFAFGAATAAVWGGAWGCCGWDDVDIDRTVNINRNDAYNRWNQGQVRSNVESRAQSLTPQQRQQVQQRAQSRGGRRHAARQRRLRGPRREHLPARRRGLGAEHRTGLEPGRLRPGQGIGGRPESRAGGEGRGRGPRVLLPAQWGRRQWSQRGRWWAFVRGRGAGRRRRRSGRRRRAPALIPEARSEGVASMRAAPWMRAPER